jgi:hypothetical protein
MQLVAQVLLGMFVNFEFGGVVSCYFKGFLLSSSSAAASPCSGCVTSKGFPLYAGT